MQPEFNPLDLSTPPKAPVVTPLEMGVPPVPQPKVNRVSVGPLFHSRLTKILAIALSTILAFLVGYTTVSFALNRRQAKVVTTGKQSTAADTSDTTIDAKALQDAAASAPAEDTPATTPSTSTPSTAATTPAKVYCGVAGMPEGACTAITSIEKDGIKGNQYVSADTSQLPDGTTTDINEKSWVQPGPELGNAGFTTKYGSSTYTGTAYFQLANNTWKVISYTLNQ